MKKILVTGGTGFVGSHLLDLCLKKGNMELYSIKRRRSNIENVKHIIDKVNWFDCDITDYHSIENVIKTIEPNIIFHLAAQSFVPASWLYPASTIETNIIGSINILEAVRKHIPDCIVQVASSSEIYGIPKILPITEDNTMPEPVSPYGVSKLAMDRFAVQYNKSYGLKTIITRAFNHVGERRGEEFVCSSFAKQIAEIERGKKPVIRVGNLDARRDFTSVKDTVDAYLLAVEKCEYGVPYNIASGSIVSIKDVLNILLSYSIMDIKIEVDQERLRPSDLHTLHGDATRFINKTGWKMKYRLEDTLLSLLNYWRKRV